MPAPARELDDQREIKSVKKLRAEAEESVQPLWQFLG